MPSAPAQLLNRKRDLAERCGPVFRLLWFSRAGRRDVDADKTGTRDCLGDQVRAARLIEKFVHDRKPRGASLRHDHGLLDTEWGTSDNNRRAKFYSLTAAGRKRLKTETDRWKLSVRAMSTALKAQEV